MNLNQFVFCYETIAPRVKYASEEKNESRCDLTAAIRYELVNFIRVPFMQLATASRELNARAKR